MSNLVITVESGSDMPEELAQRYGIFVIPMYVQFGDETREDGSFPPSEVCRYFKETGQAPKTSGSTPEDYRKVFDEIHRRWPEKKILHLAYSAVTTCSYQSACLAVKEREYAACVDTRHVTAGMTAAVMAAVMPPGPPPAIQTVLALAALGFRSWKSTSWPEKGFTSQWN